MLCQSGARDAASPVTASSNNIKLEHSNVKQEDTSNSTQNSIPKPKSQTQTQQQEVPHVNSPLLAKEDKTLSNDTGEAVPEDPSNHTSDPQKDSGQTDDQDDAVINTNNELQTYIKPLGPEDNCDLNPEFAIICAFIAHFGDKIDLELNIEQLKSCIENQHRLDNRLIDLHVKLLKKLRRYFVRDQWEKALIRFVAEYSYEDAYEIEQLGYLKIRPSVKLQLLRRLLEAQFECDQKFKALINTLEAKELRLLPLGRDIKGNTYWQRSDSEGNFRIFQEQPMDYKSWKAICSKPEELKYLIDDLEATKTQQIKGEPMTEPYDPLPEVFPEFFLKSERVEDEEEPPETKKTTSKPKKGRRGYRGKKINTLTSVKEEEGEESVDKPEYNLNSITEDACSKQAIERDLPSPSANQPFSDTHVVSTESQVMTVLENLINRVVSSVDFLRWPLSVVKSEVKKVNVSIESNTSDQFEEKPERKPKKRQPRKERPKEEILPRRSSSRIQQLQLKKVAEDEEKMKKMIASNDKPGFVPEPDDGSRSRSVCSRKSRQRSNSPDEDSRQGRKRRKKKQTWRRGKGKKKLSWDKDDSDLSSTSSLTESNDDDLDEELEEAFKFDTNDLDDEFACEDEETNNEPVIVKRARTARQSIANDTINGDTSIESISMVEEDKPCGRCDKSNDPESILLCDMCDDGYHLMCCLPPLMIVPEGDWFCPPCEHNTLVSKLKELFDLVTEILAERERERIKRQRLRQNAPKREARIASDEILPSKRSRDILGQLNDPIALQALDEELEDSSNAELSDDYRERAYTRKKRPSPASRKPAKKYRSKHGDEEEFRVNYKRTKRTYSRQARDTDESESESEEESSEESEPELQPKTRRARNCVSYRFQEYDELIKSAIQAETSESGKAIGGDEEEDEEDNDDEDEVEAGPRCRGKDMATIEALAYQQENGITDQPLPLPSATTNQEAKQKSRKKSRRLNDLDADSGTEEADSDESFQASSATEIDEEEEDDDITEDDSEDTSIDEILIPIKSRFKRNKGSKKKKKRRSSYESDDSDFKPRTSRRAAVKQVSYKESSEEDDDFLEKKRQVKKKNVIESESGESDASWKSPPKSGIQDDEESTSLEFPEPAQQNEVDSEPVEASTPIKPTDPEHQSPVTDETAPRTVKSPKGKKVKLEKKKTKPILEQSVDEIAHVNVISHSQAIGNESPPPGIRQLQHGSSIVTIVPPNVRDPIQELNQYCKDSSNNPTTMFNSYNETLTRDAIASNPPTPPPPFYPVEEQKPTSSNIKPKRQRKQKQPPKPATPPLPSSAMATKMQPVDTQDKRQSAQPSNNMANPPSMISSERPPMQPQRFEQALPSRQTRPLVPTPPMYHVSQKFTPQMYPIPPGPLAPVGTYGRGPRPNKYAIPPPPPQAQPHITQPNAGNRPPLQNQMHPSYPPSPYGSGIPPLLVQHPNRSSIPMSPYPGGTQMWTAVPVSGAPGTPLPSQSRQPVPNMFYSPSVPPGVPNPNFSIHQLLGNPYQHIAALPIHPQHHMVGHPAHPIGGETSMGSQQSTALSQTSSTADGSSTTTGDKDMIRGMSDVISFIGDT